MPGVSCPTTLTCLSMGRTATPPAPIPAEELEALRARVEAGDAPPAYLLVDTAVAAAGARVAILRVEDPAAGEDCVVVRLGDDELPFAPRELSLRPLRRARRTDVAPAVARPRPQVPAAAPPPVAPLRPAAAAAPRPAAAPQPAPLTAIASPDPAPQDPAAPVRRQRPQRASRPQPLTVTLRFTGAAWTLEHSSGGRKGAPQPLSPAAVRALADRVDDMQVRATLLAAVEQSRRDAAEQAAALRAQLAVVETVLAELDD